MKNTLLIALFAFSLTNACAQKENSCTISGEVNTLAVPIYKVYISYEYNNLSMEDSVEVKSGKYQFKINIDRLQDVTLMATTKRGASPEEDLLSDSVSIYQDMIKSGAIKVFPMGYTARLRARDRRYECRIFMGQENVRIVHKSSFSDISVTGAKWEAEFAGLIAKARAYRKLNIQPEYDSLAYYDAIGDSVSEKLALNKGNAKMKEMVETVYVDYAKHHPSSAVSVFALYIAAVQNQKINADSLKTVYNNLDDNLKKSLAGVALHVQIEAMINTVIGKPEIDFTMNDTSGMPVTLSSFKGKYVLLDFWASWCHPCREENPNLLKAFNQFKNKGFTVLSVSLDDQSGREAWLKAIYQDNLQWTHLCDLRGWKNEAAQLYNVTGVPDNFLIDPSGKIIARGLRGQALEDTLNEQFKNN